MNTIAEPSTRRFPAERLFAALISGAALAALATEIAVGQGSAAANAGGLLRFFTIWGNVGAFAVMGWAASGRPVAPKVMAALATMLTVIGSVYWALLAADHHPEGWQLVTNQVFHTLVPIAVVAWWLRFTPPTADVSALIPAIMTPPLAYGAFAVVLGELTGFYAYFFLDLTRLGAFQYAISNVVLAAFFAMVGAGLATIKNALNARF
ncbi:hypothetical protein EH30_11395 [Erythrobacter sp. JL475]|jgi:hypothetical protein|nr:hypothetical protein EH30_11395 [Erythrobacter sp. JL475]